MIPKIKQAYSNDTSIGELCCPGCGSAYLHRVWTEARPESVAFRFSCETCSAEPVLVMTPHKGTMQVTFEPTHGPDTPTEEHLRFLRDEEEDYRRDQQH